MEKVSFINDKNFFEKAERQYHVHKKRILESLPEADIQHVGSSSIPNSITKGDLDLQVRVTADCFSKAVEVLSRMYDKNEGSTKTDYFQAFKDDSIDPPLGVQLTVIDSELDFFWKFRDVLLQNSQYINEYNQLKLTYEGGSLECYRQAKQQFIEKIMLSPEYKGL